jgi:DNA-binding NtrC family response regulator
VKTTHPRVPHVLIGDFGAIGGMGLRSFLTAEGVEFESNGASVEEVTAHVVDGATKVVVLDRQMPGADAAVARISAEHPTVTVIVCSLDHPTMTVFPAHGGTTYESPLSAPMLACAVRST